MSDLNKRSLQAGLKKTVMTALVVVAGFLYLTSRYTIGANDLEISCLPYDYFIVDKWDKEIARDHYFVFAVHDIDMYQNGDQLIKWAAGVPGDRITVLSQVEVNGTVVGELHDRILRKLGVTPHDLAKTENVPVGKLFGLGTHPRTYDSRYFGYVDKKQIVGRAYPIW